VCAYVCSKTLCSKDIVSQHCAVMLKGSVEQLPLIECVSRLRATETLCSKDIMQPRLVKCMSVLKDLSHVTRRLGQQVTMQMISNTLYAYSSCACVCARDRVCASESACVRACVRARAYMYTHQGGRRVKGCTSVCVCLCLCLCLFLCVSVCLCVGG
jgi:hypothetical protein